jgi:hypothetical protein
LGHRQAPSTPFDPYKEKLEILMSWADYRGLIYERGVAGASIAEDLVLLQSIRASVSRDPLAEFYFSDFLDFSVQAASVHFLRAWIYGQGVLPPDTEGRGSEIRSVAEKIRATRQKGLTAQAKQRPWELGRILPLNKGKSDPLMVIKTLLAARVRLAAGFSRGKTLRLQVASTCDIESVLTGSVGVETSGAMSGAANSDPYQTNRDRRPIGNSAAAVPPRDFRDALRLSRRSVKQIEASEGPKPPMLGLMYNMLSDPVAMKARMKTIQKVAGVTTSIVSNLYMAYVLYEKIGKARSSGNLTESLAPLLSLNANPTVVKAARAIGRVI